MLSARTGHDRSYPDNPYVRYRDPDNSRTAFPVPELDPRRPPKEMVLGIPSPDRASAGAGRRLSFEVSDGAFRDRETGSVWGRDGVADRGELAGAPREHAEEPYLAFWFAWALFQPDTEIWEASDGSQEG